MFKTDTDMLNERITKKFEIDTTQLLQDILGKRHNSIYKLYLLPQTLYQPDVPDSAFLTTYHSLHMRHRKRSS
jgi:hypothetical protein